MARYHIIRQDDNGVKYTLEQKYDSQEEAETEKGKPEKRAHKQTYWVEEIKE